jgi:hypothetical protein
LPGNPIRRQTSCKVAFAWELNEERTSQRQPLGFYLIASGKVIDGSVLIGVGEVAKITIVERIFHAGRDKLMTIPAFAWCYEYAMSLRAYFETLAVWQVMLNAVRSLKERARRMLAFAKDYALKRAR